MVQHIEKLRAELHIESLGNTRYTVVFEQRPIDVQEARPDGYVASSVTQPVRGSGCGEARHIDVVSRISGVDGVVASRRRQAVRVVIGEAGYLGSERVAANQRSERLTG